MNIVYKGILTIIFTLLVTACGSSKSKKTPDKNATDNQSIVVNNSNTPENNTTQEVPENNTTQEVPENNTTQEVPENNTTQEVPENNTTQEVPENNTTQEVPENNTTQEVPENNTTQEVPENNTTQEVPENNTTQEVPENNTTQEVPENNTATIYENAENRKKNNWIILSNDSNEARISNTYDDEKDSRVIYLNAKIKDNNKKSYDTFKFDGISSNKKNPYIKWDMKFNQKFTISVNITTKNGNRWLNYLAKDTGAGISIKYPDSIIHGIGSNKTNNKWHTITRDLDRDVKRYEPNNNFMNINYMTIRGGGYIDNITSYSKEDNLKINKPVTVSKPGIVLTFDDSYIPNWNNMQPTFKEHGARATFFCNRWDSSPSLNWNLPDGDIAILKSFQEYGHEIAYHTRDHVNTRDKRYKDEENKAQAYLDDQITPGIVYMRKKGFEPASFSYPFISGQPAHNELIRQELPHIREFFSHVTLLDEPGKKSLDDIKRHLEKLKKDQDIGVFLSHWIHYIGDNDSESKEHKYKIEEETLIQIMDMIDEMGLQYYTLEEAHTIYMNQ